MGSRRHWSCLQLTSRMDLFPGSGPDLSSASSLRTDLLRSLSTPSGPYDSCREEKKHSVCCRSSLLTNEETIKTGSHISSQSSFFEKLRWKVGDGWGFKVTAEVYDCYRTRSASLTNVPISGGCRGEARSGLLSPPLQKMDVCLCGLWQSNVSWHASWVY